MASSRRAVITGLGVLSPIGLSLTEYWQSLCQGKSGVRPIQSFDVSVLPTRIAGEVPGFDARNFVDKKDRKSLRMMARTIQLAVSAANLALQDGRVEKDTLDPTRFGVIFGSGLMASELEELGAAAQASVNCQPDAVDLDRWGEQGIGNIPPLWMLKYLPNMPACHVSIMHNAQGPSNSITESEVASLLAIGEAFRVVGRQGGDFFLTGGGDSRINPLSFTRQCLFQPFTRRNDAPEKASRPFDRRRDGMVIGEGAAVLVLEDLDHARRRGARIYAEMVGFGAAFDRDKTGAGLARAIRAALVDAGIGPHEIDHVNAHGLSTVEADAWEARGLHEVFGSCQPTVPVFAAKSYFGNLGAGSGATELVASLLALQHGALPPTLNYEEPDPACPITVATGSMQPVQRPYVLKVGFTDMGQCAAIICRKWDS
jgi:3-oxoacyl-[acyl-carrier-protein] synthase II